MRTPTPTSLTVLVVVLYSCIPDSCPPGFESHLFPRYRLSAPSQYSYDDLNPLLAGGARAAVVVDDYNYVPYANVWVVSSNPDVLRVATPTDDFGKFTVLTGDAGTAELTVSLADGGRTLQTAQVKVLAADGLAREEGAEAATSGAVVEGERVSLAVTPTAGKDALYGSGLVTFALAGTLSLAPGAQVDGENRVFFTGAPGDGGTVRASLGRLHFDYPIEVIARRELQVEIAPGGSSIKDSPKRHLAVTLRAAGRAGIVHGGRCAWTPTTVEVEDHTLLERLEDVQRYAWVTLPPTGSITVTCTIRGASASFLVQ